MKIKFSKLLISTTVFSSLFYSSLTLAETVDEILAQYYPINYPPKQCQGIIANNGATGGEGIYYKRGYCVEVDRKLLVNTPQGKRLYMLITGDVAFNEEGTEAFGSHADTGLVGMLVLKPEGKGWQVEYANAAMNAGSYGTGLRDWKLIQVASDKWGFINIHSDSHFGSSFASYILLTPNSDNDGIINNEIMAAYSSENAQPLSAAHCTDSSVKFCALVKAKLGIDNHKVVNGFYPLKVTLNGHEYNYDGSEKTVYDNKIYNIEYVPKAGYVPPEDYPD